MPGDAAGDAADREHHDGWGVTPPSPRSPRGPDGKDGPSTPTAQHISNVSFNTQVDIIGAREAKNLSFGCRADQPLKGAWHFWLAGFGGDGGESCVCDHLGCVATVRSFWRFYNRLRPDDKQQTTLFLLPEGVDPNSTVPGPAHFEISAQSRPALNRLWLDVALALVGSQLRRGGEIRGCACDVPRKAVAVWISDADDVHLCNSIGEQLQGIAPRGSQFSFHRHPPEGGEVEVPPPGGGAAGVAPCAPRRRRNSGPTSADVGAAGARRNGGAPEHRPAARDLFPSPSKKKRKPPGSTPFLARSFGPSAASSAAGDAAGQGACSPGDASAGRRRSKTGSAIRRSNSSGDLDLSSDKTPGYLPTQTLHVPTAHESPDLSSAGGCGRGTPTRRWADDGASELGNSFLFLKNRSVLTKSSSDSGGVGRAAPSSAARTPPPAAAAAGQRGPGIASPTRLSPQAAAYCPSDPVAAAAAAAAAAAGSGGGGAPVPRPPQLGAVEQPLFPQPIGAGQAQQAPTASPPGPPLLLQPAPQSPALPPESPPALETQISPRQQPDVVLGFDGFALAARAAEAGGGGGGVPAFPPADSPRPPPQPGVVAVADGIGVPTGMGGVTGGAVVFDQSSGLLIRTTAPNMAPGASTLVACVGGAGVGWAPLGSVPAPLAPTAAGGVGAAVPAHHTAMGAGHSGAIGMAQGGGAWAPLLHPSAAGVFASPSVQPPLSLPLATAVQQTAHGMPRAPLQTGLQQSHVGLGSASLFAPQQRGIPTVVVSPPAAPPRGGGGGKGKAQSPPHPRQAAARQPAASQGPSPPPNRPAAAAAEDGRRPPLRPLGAEVTPEGWDVGLMLRYLEARAGLQGIGTAEAKFSKSRSPRNRRKIRERKIREAAQQAQREMELWAPRFQAPADAWIHAAGNCAMLRPQAVFPEEDWFRMLQACRKEGVSPRDIVSLDDAGLELLGAESAAKRQALRLAPVLDGPRPHPLGALAEEMVRFPIALPALPAPDNEGNLLAVPDDDYA